MAKNLQNLLFDLKEYNSAEPIIKLIKEEKFYKFKPPKSILNARYKFLKIRSLLSAGEYTKYLKYEKKAKLSVLNSYPKNDRFILFLHFVLGFGRRRIHNKTRISERYIRTLLKELN